MKSAIALKVSLLIIVLGLLTSCGSPQKTTHSHRSSVPEHCGFQEHKKVNKKKSKKAQKPPSKVTPIGGNYKVRS
jgi:hypothetical protein